MLQPVGLQELALALSVIAAHINSELGGLPDARIICVVVVSQSLVEIGGIANVDDPVIYTEPIDTRSCRNMSKITWSKRIPGYRFQRSTN